MDVGFAVPNLTVWNITLSEHKQNRYIFHQQHSQVFKGCIRQEPYLHEEKPLHDSYHQRETERYAQLRNRTMC